MSENTTVTGGGVSVTDIPLSENEHVKELLGILKDNGKDASGLNALLGHVNEMENFVKLAENRIADMKAQLDTMKEMQDHPIKTKLQKTIKALEAAVAQMKKQLSELKTSIVEGCKNAVTAFKEKGISALDKLMSFFHIKGALQAIKNSTVKSVDLCDKSVAQIESFSKEYHATGRHLKNMARVMVGKEPIDAVKESGKLAKAVSAPYRAQKACLLGIRKAVNAMITKLEKLEQSAEAKRGEKAADKKPTLMERLNDNKEKIKHRELEKPTPERAPKARGLEV